MARRFPARLAPLVIMGALALVLMTSGGCALFGFLAYTFTPPRVEAMYKPPLTPILVLVENRDNPGMLVAETDQLTAFILDELAAFEVAPLIPRDKLEHLRDSNPDIDKLTISQIGKELGAQQVLYVDLQRISIGALGGIPAHGRVDARVHMVDVATGKMTFPRNSEEGWPISIETPITQDIKESDLPGVSENLLRAAGTTIGRMFHKYNPEG